ncbi:MAG: c-type cytochrome [Thermodesulfobacteriota bacterium]
MGMMWMKAPSAEEQEIIVAYLKAHSLKPMTPGSLPSPESPGAISFKNTCSQCHALPDPKLHNAEEWSGVVERMRVNMQTMGKPVITEVEKEKIVGYLSQYSK